jgi:hypothetical protein
MNTVKNFYVENPRKKTMHLAAMGFARSTRCGQTINEDWIDGEETTDGLMTTCKQCWKAMQRLAKA